MGLARRRPRPKLPNPNTRLPIKTRQHGHSSFIEAASHFTYSCTHLHDTDQSFKTYLNLRCAASRSSRSPACNGRCNGCCNGWPCSMAAAGLRWEEEEEEGGPPRSDNRRLRGGAAGSGRDFWEGAREGVTVEAVTVEAAVEAREE